MGVQHLSGANFSGYQLHESLGFSSHTAVYRASSSRSGKWAVKVVDGDLEPEAGLADRLRRDADLLSRTDHPEILPIYDVARYDTLTFAASPLLAAPTLRDLLEQGPLEDDMAWGVLCQLADTLDRLHAWGLSHRGVKPVNILIDEGGRIRLVEFGISSRWTGQLALAAPDYRLADPCYLAPEQVRGEETDGRADVYALGVLAFELLTGRSPFASERAARALRSSLHAPPPAARTHRPKLPPGVDVVLRRALAKDPEHRYRSASELIDQLIELPTELMDSESHHAHSGGLRARPAPQSAMALLERLGVPQLHGNDDSLLNAFHATALRACHETAGESWSDVLALAGLERYLEEEPADDANRTASIESLCQLAAGVEALHGERAAVMLRKWGRLTMEHWLTATQRKPFRMRGRPDQRLRDTLYVLTRTLDRVRGEQLHLWHEFDRRQIWVVYADNLLAKGRPAGGRACQFSIGGLESALQWGGLAKEWAAEEVECGRVTGSGTCVFSIEYVTHRDLHR